jgi:hypothetical protein
MRVINGVHMRVENAEVIDNALLYGGKVTMRLCEECLSLVIRLLSCRLLVAGGVVAVLGGGRARRPVHNPTHLTEIPSQMFTRLVGIANCRLYIVD